MSNWSQQMATFRVEIDTGNAAFDDYPLIEVARILRALAADIEVNDGVPFNLRDVNGNMVGSARLEP